MSPGTYDDFEGAGGGDGAHHVRVPYHLAPGVKVAAAGAGAWRLTAATGEFLLIALDAESWPAALGDGWVSPRYGVKVPAPVLNFVRDGSPRPLAVALMPAEGAPDDPRRWLAEQAEAAMRLPGMARG